MRLFIGLALLGATVGSVASAEGYIEDGAIAARSKKAPAEVDYGALVNDEIAAEALRKPEPHVMEVALRDADNALASAERLSKFREMVSHVTGLVPAGKIVEESLGDAANAAMSRAIPQPIERVVLPEDLMALEAGEDEPVADGPRSYEEDIAAILEEYEDEDYGK